MSIRKNGLLIGAFLAVSLIIMGGSSYTPNAGVPYSGAGRDVDLNSHALSGVTTLDTSGNITTSAGAIEATSGDISAKTGGKLYAYEAANVKNVQVYHNGSNAMVDVSSGDLSLNTSLVVNGVSSSGTIIGSQANEAFRADGLATGSPFISFTQVGARLSFIQHNDVDDQLKITSEYGDIVFLTATDGNEVERMKIGDDGNVTMTGTLTGVTEITAEGLTLTTNDLTLTGNARVTCDLWLDAGGISAPGAKPATFVEHGIVGAWQFADAIEANQEHVSGTLKIPCDMDRTVVPVFKIGWEANGVSPGNCKWQLEYLWIGPDEDATAAAQETLTVTVAASATSHGLTISSFSGIDLPDATDQALFFRITRLSGDAADTIADTVEMNGRLFTYTADKLGGAL